MKVLSCLFFISVVATVIAYDEYEEDYENGPVGEDFSYEHVSSDENYARGQGYGPHAGGNFGKMGYGGDRGFKSSSYGGYSGKGGSVGRYKGGGGNPLVMEAMYNGPNQKVAGGRFGLGYGGIKSAVAPIVNSAYQGNFSPMKKFGMGGFGGHGNYAGGEINNYLKHMGERPVDPDDLDGDNVPDFLQATKHKIDNYIAKQWLLGRRKLTVSVNYANMPLEYLYLSQYHGFPNPVAGTPLGKKFGLTTKPNEYNNPKTPGVYTKEPKQEKKYMKKLERPPPQPPKKGGYAHDEKPKESYGEPKKNGGEPGYGSKKPESKKKGGEPDYGPGPEKSPKQEYKSDSYQTDFGKGPYQTTPYGQNKGYQAPQQSGFQPAQQQPGYQPQPGYLVAQTGYQPAQSTHQQPQQIYQPQQDYQFQQLDYLPAMNVQQPQQVYQPPTQINYQQQPVQFAPPQEQYQPQSQQMGQFAPPQDQYQQPPQQMGQFAPPQDQYQQPQQIGQMNGQQFGQPGQFAPQQQNPDQQSGLPSGQFSPPGSQQGQFGPPGGQPGGFGPPVGQFGSPGGQPGGQFGPPGGQMPGRSGDQMQMPDPSSYNKSPIERTEEQEGNAPITR